MDIFPNVFVARQHNTSTSIDKEAQRGNNVVIQLVFFLNFIDGPMFDSNYSSKVIEQGFRKVGGFDTLA